MVSCDPDANCSDEFSYLYSLYKVEVYKSLFTGAVYGAYIVVYLTSVYVLLSKPGFTSSWHRIFLFGITTLMFAMGIVTLILETRFKFWSAIAVDSEGIIIGPPDQVCYKAWAIITCLMYSLCDTICAWRTVVIWNKDKRIICILVCFLLMTTVTASIALSCDLINAHWSLGSPFLGGGRMILAFGESGSLVLGPTLGTNLLSTGLIAWKAWKRRIEVKEHLREGKGSVRVDRVFVLLVESGLIYSCIWIVYSISVSTSTKLPNPGLTSMALISGLYPTLIIILVSKQMSPVEHYSTDSTDSDSDSTEIRCAAVPTPRTPTDVSVGLVSRRMSV